MFVLGRPGSDLLFQVLRLSTISAGEINGRVRDGIGYRPPAKTTRPAKDECEASVRESEQRSFCFSVMRHLAPVRGRMGIGNERDQAIRAISTGKLNALPHLHTRPINVVVYHGSQGRTRFEVGFSLRCLQRLSRPYIATLHCSWRHNSSTRGTFIPVLTYYFNRRTAEPLGPAPAPGCDEPTSRCQTMPSIWTLGHHQPVIPGVPFIR